jgi:hypothetical protein
MTSSISLLMSLHQEKKPPLNFMWEWFHMIEPQPQLRIVRFEGRTPKLFNATHVNQRSNLTTHQRPILTRVLG